MDIYLFGFRPIYQVHSVNSNRRAAVVDGGYLIISAIIFTRDHRQGTNLDSDARSLPTVQVEWKSDAYKEGC